MRLLWIFLGAMALLAVVGLIAGMPQLLPAAILSGIISTFPEFIEDGEQEMKARRIRLYVAPTANMALLICVTMFPFVLTPAFLAPQIPLSDVQSGLGAYRFERVYVEGTVVDAEAYPMGIGEDEPVLVTLSDEGVSARILVDARSVSEFPKNGQRVVATGVVDAYVSQKVWLFCRSLEIQ